MTIPTDTLYGQQWHFNFITNNNNPSLMEKLWDEFTGNGVAVAVYDTGVEYSHADLNDNYDASKHVVFDHDGNPMTPDLVMDGNVLGTAFNGDGHGTSCAGIIAAEANGVDTVGIAFNANLTGVNIFVDPATNPALPERFLHLNTAPFNGFMAAIRQMANFDVTNNSWGSNPFFDPSQNLTNAAGFAARTAAEYQFSAENGRSGLGTVIVQSAGNSNTDANGSGLNASRHNVTVAALLETGFAASYSSFGANVLVSSAGGDVYVNSLAGDFDTVNGTRLITTTDRAGGNGFNDLTPDANGADPGGYSFTPADFTDSFNGTSAAGPMVAGIVALMLDANPDLGWRDVQNILAATAFQTGSGLGNPLGLNESITWATNDADNWNGGGMHISEDYGYGNADAFGAVRMAEAFDVMGSTALTSANEVSAGTAVIPVALAPPDASLTFVSSSFAFASSLVIEHVALTLDIQHQDIGDLQIFLTSAEGTQIRAHQSNPAAGGNFQTWTFGIDLLRGELSNGTWTLNVRDLVVGDTGTINSIQMTVFGQNTPADINDTYHYTNEFDDMSTFQAARLTLADTDGGTDWFDGSALLNAAILDLNDGANSDIDGKIVTIAAGTLIENAILSDGNDTVSGNELGNILHGMRGNDTLNGEAGIDTVFGGAGNDTVFVNDSADVVTETSGAGTDIVLASATYALSANVENLQLLGALNIHAIGNTLNNQLTGNTLNNILNGSSGADTMNAGMGNDVYVVDNVGDVLSEAGGSGIDTVQSQLAINLATLGNAFENATLVAGLSVNLTGNVVANKLTGNSGNNTLNGNGHNDTLTGGGGNDLYICDAVGDVVSEVGGSGIDTVQCSVTRTLETDVENMTLVGVANITANGNGLNNKLTGNAGNNTLEGLAGADIMLGGAGNDVYRVDNASDQTTESLGNGTDLVVTTVNRSLGANLENLTLGGAASLGFGNELANAVTGNAGNNTLFGLLGNDTMNGGGGSDRFAFTTALNGTTNVDVVLAFNVVDDLLALDDLIFTGIGAVLDAGEFVLAAVAQDGGDRIVYDKPNGDLFFDPDGTGAGLATKFADMSLNPNLSHLDFQMI